MSKTKTLIRFDRVGIAFPDLNLLQNVSFDLLEHESLVLVGPSGEGKSVLLKMAGGILPPTSGEVFIDGQSLYKISEDEKIQVLRRMGMLFQKNALFDSFTCKENIAFALRETTDTPENEIEEICMKFLEDVGIPHAKDLYPDEISGGMQKRLGIARALALKPEIIFYDDPTAGLDPITSRKIIELILELKEEYKSTVIAITNDMNRAYQMADKIALVAEGGLKLMNSVDEAKESQDPRVFQFLRGNLKGPLTKAE